MVALFQVVVIGIASFGVLAAKERHGVMALLYGLISTQKEIDKASSHLRAGSGGRGEPVNMSTEDGTGQDTERKPKRVLTRWRGRGRDGHIRKRRLQIRALTQRGGKTTARAAWQKRTGAAPATLSPLALTPRFTTIRRWSEHGNK